MRRVSAIFPPQIRGYLEELTQQDWDRLEEIRLSSSQPVRLCFRDGERNAAEYPISVEDLELVLELACRASMHTVLNQVRQGFLTLPGGHRLGICGSVRMREGEIHAITPVSSLNLRLARQVRGIGEPLIETLCAGGNLKSTLILAPPGAGKTTLLRDVIRCLSDGIGCQPHRVSLADERGEVAALDRGCPQLDVGSRTDVMEGCPKVQALMLLLRGMNPHVLAADEITASADIQAMEQAVGCGTELLCTAHGADRQDLVRRPLYREMGERGLFQKLVLIRVEQGMRRYEVEDLM